MQDTEAELRGRMEYRGFTLDPFQAEAIDALNRGSSVLVAAPTGTGKTVVADYVVEQALNNGREVIYTAPIKALSNQKYRDYCTLVGEEKVGLVTGDLVIRRDAPCKVMTTEILRNMLLGGEKLENLAAVVIDEIHFLDDHDRGTVWEEVLIYLPDHVRIVGLSATLSNLNDFAAWLSDVRGEEVHVVIETERSVPLAFQIATKQRGLVPASEMDAVYKEWYKGAAKNGRHLGDRKGKKDRHQGRGGRGGRDRRRPRLGLPTRHFHVFRMLADTKDLPYLYFVFSRQHAEQLARDLCSDISEAGVLAAGEQAKIIEMLEEFEARVGKGVLGQEHRRMLCLGVGFHHAGLHVQLKTITERLYEARLLKVLYCTGTFALGINMPARAACFDAMMRFDGRRLIPLPAREFMQMAGRAGRRGLDDFGQVVIRTDIEDWPTIAPQLRAYLTGVTEPVKSRFSLSFNSVVNLMHRHSPEQVRDVVEQSFLAWYRRKAAERHSSNAKMLETAATGAGNTSEAPMPKQNKKQLRRAKRLNQRASDSTDQTWIEFQTKIRFLQHWGYLAEDYSFNAGAKALMHIQISEIFTTELFLSGALDDTPPDRLFGVLTGMCNTLNKRVEVNSTKADRQIGAVITKIRSSPIVTAADELSGSDTTWDTRMIWLGTMWAQGKSLAEIMAHVESPTDVTGDLVGAFRRAKELAGQLKALWIDDEAKVAEINRLIREVTRDEVSVVG
jgi:ATP-dependent RNA helicase HelY